jgi:type III pantothenate kinase
MTPDVVVDVGNTRVKWGQVDRNAIARTVSLPEDPDAWEKGLASWGLEAPLTWVLASVRPQRSERLQGWLIDRGHRVLALTRADQLPLEVGLEYPDRVGIDRLLDAVAAKELLPLGQGAVLIDAGSAVTIDWLDEEHVFRGGAIYPGIDLMAQALHNYTAFLPRVEVTSPLPDLPAGATVPAMQVGIFLAVSGGIREAVRIFAEKAAAPPKVFFTGGQAPLLSRAMGAFHDDVLLWPNQTLDGILRSAEQWDE